MENSFKNKNVLVIVFEICIIVLGLAGITYAATRLANNRSSVLLKAGEYNIDYVGDSNVVANNLEPISDSLINANTKDKVIRLEFSLKGVASNDNDNLIYDVMISNFNIDCSLLNKYTKWNLYKNNTLLSSGSLDPTFDGDILSESMRLTDIQQDLPEYNSEYDKYVLIFWISEACEDLTKCEMIDQSNILNSSMSMKVFIALYSGNKEKYKRVPNYDASCANKPILSDRMIPVYYNDGAWKIANSNNNNKDNLWYDYSNSKWANAVVVSNNKYSAKSVGTVIDTSDILAYYVWIPRFKYKTWNVSNEVMDSYDAYNKGIDIVFENGLNTSGIKCDKTKCSVNNDEYLTHPAFSLDIYGFWVSKYELSDGNKFIPGVTVLKNQLIENYNESINNLVNTYSLDSDFSSHIINNLEWGATLYLSHSKYGVCTDMKCAAISSNTTYTTGSNKQDTTTRNVYGVYDMAGSTAEYVSSSLLLGSATKEVMNKDNMLWYGAYAVSANNSEYLIRGGLDNGLFSYNNQDVSSYDVSTRSVLINKKS